MSNVGLLELVEQLHGQLHAAVERVRVRRARPTRPPEVSPAKPGIQPVDEIRRTPENLEVDAIGQRGSPESTTELAALKEASVSDFSTIPEPWRPDRIGCGEPIPDSPESAQVSRSEPEQAPAREPEGPAEGPRPKIERSAAVEEAAEVPVREHCPRCGKHVGDNLVTWRGESLCLICAAEVSREDTKPELTEAAATPASRECPICLMPADEEFVSFRDHTMCRGCAELLDDGTDSESIEAVPERFEAAPDGIETAPVATPEQAEPARHGTETEEGTLRTAEPEPKQSDEYRPTPAVAKREESNVQDPRGPLFRIGQRVVRWEVTDRVGSENADGTKINWTQPLVVTDAAAFLFVELYARQGRGGESRTRHRFLSDQVFRWAPLNAAPRETAAASSLRSDEVREKGIHLLVRRSRQSSGAVPKFTYLGRIELESWRDNQQTEIVWRLHDAVPAKLWEEMEVPAW